MIKDQCDVALGRLVARDYPLSSVWCQCKAGKPKADFGFPLHPLNLK